MIESVHPHPLLSENPIWIEGPHLYQHDGWYYLSCAEGGTGPQHSQVVLRSRNLAPTLLAAFDGASLPALTELVFFGFGDVARVALIDPEPGQQRRSTLMGTGIGVRLGIQEGLSLALDWARRHRDVAGRNLPIDRVHMRAALRF